MSDLFDFEAGEKHHDDVYTVMGRAIRKHFNNDETKITSTLARVISQIIDSGFLDSAIEEKEQLIKYEEKRLQNARKQADEMEHHYKTQKDEATRLDGIIRDKRHVIDEYRKIMDEGSRGDDDLENAKIAFIWILNETHSTEAASKAFNSYLLGKSKREEERERIKIKNRLVDKLKDILENDSLGSAFNEEDDDGWTTIRHD